MKTGPGTELSPWPKHSTSGTIIDRSDGRGGGASPCSFGGGCAPNGTAHGPVIAADLIREIISMHSACTQHALSMHSACNQHALSMHSACTQHALGVHSPPSRPPVGVKPIGGTVAHDSCASVPEAILMLEGVPEDINGF